MQAVILAAGRGTRMGELTSSLPKPLLAVGGRPLVAHIIAALQAAGLTRIVIVTGYLAHKIEEALGDGSVLGVDIVYRRQPSLDGTADALLRARDALTDGPFVLTWGDVLMLPAAYRDAAHAFHAAGRCDAMLTLNRVDDPWRGAAVYVDEDWRVLDIIEKPPRGTSDTPWNNAGLFALDPVVFDYASRVTRSPRGEYELPHAFAAMLADGRDLRGRPLQGLRLEVGAPEDLRAAETKLSRLFETT